MRLNQDAVSFPLRAKTVWNYASYECIKEDRSVCSKIKRSVDIASSGKNGLNIRTNASPKWDRTRCPEEYASSVG